MADIFLSYSTSDRPRAQAVAELLEKQGWSVWWDREISVGRSWDEVIEEEISQARSIVVLWSPVAVKSDWVKNEARDAKDRHIIVPATIAPTKLPLEFRHLQTANLTNWNPGELSPEFNLLLKGLRRILTSQESTPPTNDSGATADGARREALTAHSVENKQSPADWLSWLDDINGAPNLPTSSSLRQDPIEEVETALHGVQNDHLFIGKKIPREKLEAAIAACAPDVPPSEVLLVYDNTGVRFSNPVLLTTTAIHWSPITATKHYKILYWEINEITTDHNLIIEQIVIDGQIINLGAIVGLSESIAKAIRAMMRVWDPFRFGLLWKSKQ